MVFGLVADYALFSAFVDQSERFLLLCEVVLKFLQTVQSDFGSIEDSLDDDFLNGEVNFIKILLRGIPLN